MILYLSLELTKEEDDDDDDNYSLRKIGRAMRKIKDKGKDNIVNYYILKV